MRTPSTLPKLLAIATIVFVAVGCAGTPAHEDGRIQVGVIESIHPNSAREVSTLTGMLLGGVLGHGNSTTENRQVGFALGALGGAWALSSSGQAIADPGYRVTVRYDDGEMGFFSNKDPVSIHVGQRVMVSAHKLYEPGALADTRTDSAGEALRSSP
jgi:outer membrane lipoprotein SlyB